MDSFAVFSPLPSTYTHRHVSSHCQYQLCMIYFDIFCDVLSNMKEIINIHLNVPKCPESLSNQSIWHWLCGHGAGTRWITYNLTFSGAWYLPVPAILKFISKKQFTINRWFIIPSRIVICDVAFVNYYELNLWMLIWENPALFDFSFLLR